MANRYGRWEWYRRCPGDRWRDDRANSTRPKTRSSTAPGNLYVADFANARVRKIDLYQDRSLLWPAEASAAMAGLAKRRHLVRPGGGCGRSQRRHFHRGQRRKQRSQGRRGNRELSRHNRGQWHARFSGDGGPATSARIQVPAALALDAPQICTSPIPGIALSGKSIYGTGTVATIAGTPGAKGRLFPATAARQPWPNYAIRRGSLLIRPAISTSPIPSTTWSAKSSPAPEPLKRSPARWRAPVVSVGTGPALSALLNNPGYPAMDGSGNLWISDQQNDVIRELGGGATLDFGDLAVSASSVPQDATLTNTGTAR